MNLLIVILLGGGVLLLYSAIKGTNPIELIKETLVRNG